MSMWRCIVAFLLIAFSAFQINAQQQVLVETPEIVEIKLKIAQMEHISDSLKSSLSSMKEVLKNAPEKRAELLQPIFDMEGQLFEVNSSIAKLVSQKNRIEQEYLFMNVGSAISDTDTLNNSSGLLGNRFVKGQLSDKELTLLSGSLSIDTLFFVGKTQLEDLYNRQEQLKQQLNSSGLDADSAAVIQTDFDELQRKVLDIRSDFKAQWGSLFDAKIYAYSRILDKMGASAKEMSSLGDEARNTRAEFSDKFTAMFAPELSIYDKEKRVVLLYEKLLAKKINAKIISDSISHEINNLGRFSFDKPSIIMDQNNYVKYSGITVAKRGVIEDEVDYVELPTNGEIYMILAATLTKPLSQTSSLRRLSPLKKFVNEKNFTEYYAGVYRTREEAVVDLKSLSALGLNPSIVNWKEGGKVKGDGTIYPADAHNYFYSLEFMSVDPELEAIIISSAPAKEIIKLDNKFQLGVFESYNQVVEIQKKLPVNSTIIKIKKP